MPLIGRDKHVIEPRSSAGSISLRYVVWTGSNVPVGWGLPSRRAESWVSSRVISVSYYEFTGWVAHLKDISCRAFQNWNYMDSATIENNKRTMKKTRKEVLYHKITELTFFFFGISSNSSSMKPSSIHEGAYPPSLSGGEGVLLLQESVREGLGDAGSGQATPVEHIIKQNQFNRHQRDKQ